MDLVGAVSDFPLVRELARLTSRQASGALSVTGDPGGTVYLTGGGISYVDTAATPGVETLLVASGRVREVDWRAAHEAGVERGQVGQVLLERGLVGRAELEVDVLGALADAAVAVVFTPGPACRFEPEARHWLGAVVRVELGALVREVARRRTALDRTRSRLASDREPVVPVRRLGRNRVAVTTAQWNVLMHADGRRSTRDLAWVLGRGVCAVTLEVHHLLERGLSRWRRSRWRGLRRRHRSSGPSRRGVPIPPARTARGLPSAPGTCCRGGFPPDPGPLLRPTSRSRRLRHRVTSRGFRPSSTSRRLLSTSPCSNG